MTPARPENERPWAVVTRLFHRRAVKHQSLDRTYVSHIVCSKYNYFFLWLACRKSMFDLLKMFDLQTFRRQTVVWLKKSPQSDFRRATEVGMQLTTFPSNCFVFRYDQYKFHPLRASEVCRCLTLCLYSLTLFIAN